jgi:hypothetical protein
LKPEFAFTEQQTSQQDINSDHYFINNQDEDTSETGEEGNDYVDEAQNHSDQVNSQDGTGEEGNEFVDVSQNHCDQGNSQDGISILFANLEIIDRFIYKY